MPGRSRGRPMPDVRPETDTGEELYPGYPGYDETAEPGDVYDDHDSREREAGQWHDGQWHDGQWHDARFPRRGPDPRDRDDAPYGGDPYGADPYGDEPLHARDYATQGHDCGDPDEEPRDRPVNGRATTRRNAPAHDDPDGYAADPRDGDRLPGYPVDDEDEFYDGPADYDGYDDDDGEYDDDEYGVGDAPLSVPPPGSGGRPLGPADVEELDPSMTDALARVALGSMQVPVPYGAELTLEPTEGGRPQAAHLVLPEGRIAVSALAAPRSAGLWRELAAEIETSLRNGGARVRNAQGDWGRELHARTENAASVFIGADGPRWMVYGVATASLETVDALDVELRRVMRGIIVVRGRLPYPPRTVLPLALPEHLADKAPAAAKPKGASITVSVPAASATGSTPRPGSTTGSTPEPARPAAAGPATGSTPVREPVTSRSAAGDQAASPTRALPPVGAGPRRDADGPDRGPAYRRESPAARFASPSPERGRPLRGAPPGRPGPPGRDPYDDGRAASSGRVPGDRHDEWLDGHDVDGYDDGRYDVDGYDDDPYQAEDDRYDDRTGQGRSRDLPVGRPRAAGPRAAAPPETGAALPRTTRPSDAPNEPLAARSTAFDRPEPIEPPVRRDPAVTALSPADLVPDPATLRSGGDRRGGSVGDPDRGRSPQRRRAADPAPGDRDVTPAAGLPRTGGTVGKRVDLRPTGDGAGTAGAPTVGSVPVSRMAIEDIPLNGVPLLDAALDAEPAPGALPRRQSRTATNAASLPPAAGPTPGGRRRRGDALPADASAGASPWMSAEIAARPGGRHARPGHRDPDADTPTAEPGPPPATAPHRNGSALGDWRAAAHREPGRADLDPDDGDLFSSPAEAGERYRRNGNGHRPPGDEPDTPTVDDPMTVFSAARDPGRHRRG